MYAVRPAFCVENSSGVGEWVALTVSFADCEQCNLNRHSNGVILLVCACNKGRSLLLDCNRVFWLVIREKEMVKHSFWRLQGVRWR